METLPVGIRKFQPQSEEDFNMFQNPSNMSQSHRQSVDKIELTKGTIMAKKAQTKSHLSLTPGSYLSVRPRAPRRRVRFTTRLHGSRLSTIFCVAPRPPNSLSGKEFGTCRRHFLDLRESCIFHFSFLVSWLGFLLCCGAYNRFCWRFPWLFHGILVRCEFKSWL